MQMQLTLSRHLFHLALAVMLVAGILLPSAWLFSVPTLLIVIIVSAATALAAQLWRQCVLRGLKRLSLDGGLAGYPDGLLRDPRFVDGPRRFA